MLVNSKDSSSRRWLSAFTAGVWVVISLSLGDKCRAKAGSTQDRLVLVLTGLVRRISYMVVQGGKILYLYHILP